MHRRPVPDDAVRSHPGYEVAHVGFNQWNGVAIASRVGLDDVEVGFDGQPIWSSKPEVGRDRRGPRDGRHLRRRAGVEPLRAQRPHPGRSALHLQAGMACRPA